MVVDQVDLPVTASIEFIQFIINERDEGNKPLGIFMDLTLAFESAVND